MANDSTVRTIEASEFAQWLGIVRTAMLGPPLDEAAIEGRREAYELDRCLAAVAADGTLCGAAHAFHCDLTVPGGQVPAAAITHVGVLPTHRRQGHLTRMMRSQLADVSQRGEPVAVLIAAEYPIYGRYGYGPATEACGLRVDVASLAASPGGGWREPPTGRVELVDNDSFAAVLPDVYERAQRRTPGHITWRKREYEEVAGIERSSGGADRGAGRKVLWRDDTGEIEGAAVYTVQGSWEHNRPSGELRANPVVAATDEAERELMRYLCAVDWISTVRVDIRPVDDPLPLWLHDGRAAMLRDRSDHVWARLLDAPAALSTRRYGTPGRLVMQVHDPLGHAAGTFALEADTEGASCRTTQARPDVVVSASALGAAYLGGVSWARMLAGGWVVQERAGAVATADAMFSTPRAPWCAHTF